MIVTSQGDLQDTVLIPYDKLFHNNNGTFHQSTITSIRRSTNGQGGYVTTDMGTEIPFDVLILAPGSSWEGGIDLPPRRADAIAFIQAWREKFKLAKGVAIIGGGAVGIGIFQFSTDVTGISRHHGRDGGGNQRCLPSS